jgi:hypothetical protein
MNTVQKIIVSILITAAVAFGIYQAQQASRLREEIKTLRQLQALQTASSAEVQKLKQERDQATNQLASLAAENAALKKNPSEVYRLRGEVGRLRQENTAIGSTNAISKITANPEARKMLRDQQKMGMGMIYRGLSKQLNLNTEQTDKLNDLLADHIMDNVNNVTTVLRDKPSAEQMNEVFVAQEALLQEKVLALVGPDGLSQYQEYNRNLLSTLSADQFKGMLSGNDEAKNEKAKQFRQVLQEEVQSALTSAGLSADHQTVPILNFRNIASESEAEKNLKLLDAVYQQTGARAGSFLSEEELKKLQEFRTKAIENNRSVLMLNRTMMAPISQ